MPSRREITDAFIHEEVGRGRRYVLAFYKATEGGPKLSEEEADRLQMDHLRFLFGLRAERKVVLNGPLVDFGVLRGIAIMDMEDVEAARAVLARDPAVKAAKLELEFHAWFGLPGDSLPS